MDLAERKLGISLLFPPQVGHFGFATLEKLRKKQREGKVREYVQAKGIHTH
jgi:hypothetical protein